MCSLDLNLAYEFTKIRADVQIKLTFKNILNYLYSKVR
jgi:outer membrane receptor protein involved in Fe transport